MGKLSPLCNQDRCEECFFPTCQCSCHEECDICGKPLNVGDHRHTRMYWDDLWGLVE